MDTSSKSEKPFVSSVFETALCPLSSELCYSLVTEDCTDLSNLWAVSGFISATVELTQVCDEHIYGLGNLQTPGTKVCSAHASQRHCVKIMLLFYLDVYLGVMLCTSRLKRQGSHLRRLIIESN